MLARTVACCIALLAAACASTSSGITNNPAAPATRTDPSNVAPTPTVEDVQILRRADELLSDPSRWNHFGDRACDDAARSWNLYCVVHRASIEVTGTFQHRSAAMQEVRWVVDDRTRGVDLAHRLMDYNNLPTTTFAEIKGVLAEAIARIEAKLQRR